MARYLLEEPWPTIVMLGCVAFALLLTGMHRRRGGYVVAAGVIVIVAAGVYVLAAMVTTDRETVEQRTRQVVAATAPLDRAALQRLIDDSAAVSLPSGSVLPLRDALTDELAQAVVRHAVEDQSISGLYAQMIGPDEAEARVDLRTRLAGDVYRPVDTQWLLSWRRDAAGDWRIVAVRWLKFENQTPTEALWY